MFTEIIITLSALILGFIGTILLFKGKGFVDIEKKTIEAEEQKQKSKKEGEILLKETQEKIEKTKKLLEESLIRKKERIEKKEENIKNRTDNLLKKEEKLKEVKLKLASFAEETQSKQSLIKRTEEKIVDNLVSTSNENKKELKEKIIYSYQRGLENENEDKEKNMEENLKENAPKIAKNIIVNIMQRLTSPTSIETKAVYVTVPKDFIKGKIVGKNAQNIKTFEELIDVAVIFNDLPQTISISSFNLVNRRIAQKAIEILVKTNGEINKKIIEIAINTAKKEIEKELYALGKETLDKMDIKEKDKELTKTIGRLQYRTSYSQNIMKHSMEVGYIAGMLGDELGLNVELCKISGFLHDLGKAIDQEEGVKDTHDELTKLIMEKYGYSEEEIHAAWSHHDIEKQKTPEALIVKAADAISASRPGARAESRYSYEEKIQALENVALSFEGVEKVHIMSAGREVRILVNPEKIKDNEIRELAQSAASQIEENVTYPGRIKVNVIRKTEFSESIKEKINN